MVLSYQLQHLAGGPNAPWEVFARSREQDSVGGLVKALAVHPELLTSRAERCRMPTHPKIDQDIPNFLKAILSSVPKKDDIMVCTINPIGDGYGREQPRMELA